MNLQPPNSSLGYQQWMVGQEDRPVLAASMLYQRIPRCQPHLADGRRSWFFVSTMIKMKNMNVIEILVLELLHVDSMFRAGEL